MLHPDEIQTEIYDVSFKIINITMKLYAKAAIFIKTK
jgi:hypothetical protein